MKRSRRLGLVHALAGLLFWVASGQLPVSGQEAAKEAPKAAEPAKDAAVAPAKAGPILMGQPRVDYQARRRALMRLIREAEAKRSGEMRGMFGRGRSGTGGEFAYEPVVVLSGQEETEGKFQQSSDFLYLTGVEAPSAALILRPNDDYETLYLPPSTTSERGMTAAQDGPGQASADKYGYPRVASTATFLADLFQAIGDPRVPARGRTRAAVVYTILHERANPADPDARLERMIREGAPTTELKNVSALIGELRKVKTEGEIALLRQAIAITGAAQAEAARAMRPGLFEYQLEARITGTFLDQGAQREGFSSIVGSGPNATIPHYFTNRRQLADGDMVVVDIGAECFHYTADITRTYPANGKFTPRQREIYQLVLDAQQDAADRMEPGKTRLREMTGWTREYLKKSPLRARDRDGQEHTMDHFFIHGLSHYLGLDVHDVGDTSKPIMAGEVFTIEPGLYIPSETIGVRIEDDYLMTEHGPEKLSKDIASDPSAVEALMSRSRPSPAAATAGEP